MIHKEDNESPQIATPQSLQVLPEIRHETVYHEQHYEPRLSKTQERARDQLHPDAAQPKKIHFHRHHSVDSASLPLNDRFRQNSPTRRKRELPVNRQRQRHTLPEVENNDNFHTNEFPHYVPPGPPSPRQADPTHDTSIETDSFPIYLPPPQEQNDIHPDDGVEFPLYQQPHDPSLNFADDFNSHYLSHEQPPEHQSSPEDANVHMDDSFPLYLDDSNTMFSVYLESDGSSDVTFTSNFTIYPPHDEWSPNLVHSDGKAGTAQPAFM